jgi:hypothetical protein
MAGTDRQPGWRAVATHCLPRLEHALWLRAGQRLQQDPIHDRKHSRVVANSHGRSQSGGKPETGVGEKGTRGQFEVLPARIRSA